MSVVAASAALVDTPGSAIANSFNFRSLGLQECDFPYSGWLRVSHGLYLATVYTFVAQTETTLIHRAFSCNFTQIDDKRHVANLILLNRNTAKATASIHACVRRKMPIGPKAVQYRYARPALLTRAVRLGGVARRFLIGVMDGLHAPDKRNESFCRRRRRYSFAVDTERCVWHDRHIVRLRLSNALVRYVCDQ